MNMKRSEVWSTFADSKPLSIVDVASEKIRMNLNITDTTSLKGILQNEYRQYLKHISNQRKLSAEKRQSFSGEDKVVVSKVLVDGDEEVDDRLEPAAKKPYKSFNELSTFRKRCRTEELVESLKSFIENEKMINENEAPLTVTQLLGHLIYRINYSLDKKTSKIGSMIMKGEKLDDFHGFSDNDAITLMHDMALSKEQLRVMRRYLMRKGMFFPTTNSLLAARKKLKPVISPILDNKGVSVDYIELTKMTTASVIDTLNNSLEAPLDTSSEYKMFLKDGGDGAGSQSVLKSKSAVGSAQNIFQYSVVPLRLEKDGLVIWRNPAANGPSWVRPIFLIREKEDEKSLLEHVIPYTDKCRNFLNSSCIDVFSFRSSLVYKVRHCINDSMKDLKFKKLISGLGGADCILCDSRQIDWMNEDKIRLGFPITRTAHETLQIYNDLVTSDGDISTSKGDYDIRKGLTQRPLSTSDQLSITITHSYINITNWFIKLLSRMNLEYEHWVEKKNCYGDPIRAGNANVLRIIEEETGLRLDQVCGPTSKGGGSTDGNQGRRFFSLLSIASILKCIPEKYHETVEALHKYLSCILRIISSQERVDLDKFEKLLENTSLLIANKLKWAKINFTLHGTIHHSAQLVALNEGYALGDLSEEGLEGNNKFIRRYSELLSRKTSQIEQLTDVMGRLLERSDPFISNEKLVYRSVVKCSVCSSKKHSTRTHDSKTSIDAYDAIVNDILIDDL